MLYQVDQAEAMVNIINKKYVTGNRMAYLALLSGVGSCRIESYPGAGHNYQAVVDAIHNCYARFWWLAFFVDIVILSAYNENL